MCWCCWLIAQVNVESIAVAVGSWECLDCLIALQEALLRLWSSCRLNTDSGRHLSGAGAGMNTLLPRVTRYWQFLDPHVLWVRLSSLDRLTMPLDPKFIFVLHVRTSPRLAAIVPTNPKSLQLICLHYWARHFSHPCLFLRLKCLYCPRYPNTSLSPRSPPSLVCRIGLN